MKIELNQEMLQVLDAALQQLPYRVAAPVINEINRQLAGMLEKTPSAGIAKTVLPADLNGQKEPYGPGDIAPMTSYP